MRHEALPQAMTPEELGVWLSEQSIDRKIYSEETPYTDDEITEFEHKSSVASRALDRLTDLEKKFKERLKNGVEEPVDVTIPPTKGSKALEANRKYADDQIEQGYFVRDIDLFAIPYPEGEKILYFDNEGNIWDDYTQDMTKEQKEEYVGLFKSGGTTEVIVGEESYTISAEEEPDTSQGTDYVEEPPEEEEAVEEPEDENQVSLDLDKEEKHEDEAPPEQTSDLEDGDIDLNIESTENKKEGSF